MNEFENFIFGKCCRHIEKRELFSKFVGNVTLNNFIYFLQNLQIFLDITACYSTDCLNYYINIIINELLYILFLLKALVYSHYNLEYKFEFVDPLKPVCVG